MTLDIETSEKVHEIVSRYKKRTKLQDSDFQLRVTLGDGGTEDLFIEVMPTGVGYWEQIW